MIYTLKTKDGQTREFWCPDSGGYVREIDDDHPGTLGKQVSYSLGYTGDMLWSDARCLADDIRAARRRELAAMRREERRWW